MARNKLPKLTPSEFEIMNAVWDEGEMTVTEVMNAVNASKEKDFKRSTIQVQIYRLEEKGWLKHSQEKNKFLFSATVPRNDASGAIVRDVHKRIFGGSCVELVKALFNHSDVSPEELKNLRKLLDEYKDND